VSAKIIVPAAIAVALLGSLPASAADLGPPGYYPPRAYQEYPAPVIRKRIIHERVVVERPLYVHRRPMVVERPIVVERPLVIEKRVVVERPVIVKRRVFIERPVRYGFGPPPYGLYGDEEDFDDGGDAPY
jgi:hypothetical protein